MVKTNRKNSSSFINSGMTTTVSITLVLFLLGLTAFVGVMGKGISEYIKENLSVTVELSDNMKKADVFNLQQQLEGNPFVKRVVYISKDEIKQQLIQDLGQDPEELIGYNPASDCFEVYLKSQYANIDSLKVLEENLKSNTIIKTVIYSEDDIDIVNANLSRIAMGLLVLAIVLIFISFTLIRNTIRLDIYAKRFTINTMRLVGATDGFIRRPFVLQTVGCGVVAAVLANIAITSVIFYFTKEYPELISIISINNLLIIYLLVFVLGILLTAWATMSAVTKYLKMETNNLYHV